MQRTPDMVFANHKAILVKDDNKTAIIDWLKNGKDKEYGIRYTIDKELGTLTIAGDLGYAVARWDGPVEIDNIYSYLFDIGYFMEKLQASSDYYVFRESDYTEHMRMLIKENCDADDIDDLELDKDISRLEDEIINGNTIIDTGRYPAVYPSEEAKEIMRKYDEKPYSYSIFANSEIKIAPRVALWQNGFRLAVRQLRTAPPTR